MYKKFEENDTTTLIGEISEEIVIRQPFYNTDLTVRKFENHYHNPVANISSSCFVSLCYAGPFGDFSAGINKLMSVTIGIHTSSLYYNSNSTNSRIMNKMYKLYAQTLLGNKNNKFQIRGNAATEIMMISVARNQIKDGIKKNSVNLGFLSDLDSQHITASSAPVAYFSDLITKEFKDSYVGQFGEIFHVNQKLTSSNPSSFRSGAVGLVFYDHGSFILYPPYCFYDKGDMSGSTSFEDAMLNDLSVANLLNGFLNKMTDISFSNISRPRISIFNCTMEKEEFNYSTNPTFKNKMGEIITNSGSSKSGMKPTTYPTQVALMNELGQIMAVGKLSSPIKKDPDKKIKINVRLIQ